MMGENPPISDIRLRCVYHAAPMRCQHCGKLTVVHTAGKGDEFTYRCQHCGGSHKFTKSGHHGSGAVNYRVVKVEAAPGQGRDAGAQSVRFSRGGTKCQSEQ